MISNLIDITIIILLFALFGLEHSLFASNWVKKFIIKKLGTLIAFYRMVYVIMSLLTLYFILQISPHPKMMIYKLNPPFDSIILIAELLSYAGLIWALRYFSILEFIGYYQILRWKRHVYDTKEMDEKLTLIIGGPYKFSRHPLYLFFIMILAFKPEMDLYYLTCLLCIIIYSYVGSIFEEQKLEEQFGDEYRYYKQLVPRILPSKFKLIKLSLPGQHKL